MPLDLLDFEGEAMEGNVAGVGELIHEAQEVTPEVEEATAEALMEARV